MEFKEKQAIYLQIADYVCDRILFGNLKTNERVLSVRELAVQLEVNPNTVMRTYDLLLKQNILNNKRGIGFFVDNEALNRIKEFRKQRFMEEELPVFLKNILLLDISFTIIEQQYNEYKHNQNKYLNENNIQK